MSININVLSIAVIAIVIIGAGLFFMSEEKPKDRIVTIRILDDPTRLNDWEIVKKMTGRDFLAEEGIKLELINSVQSTGGTQSLQALLAKNIDFAGSSWTSWINVIGSGGKIKAVVGRSVRSKDDPSFTWVVLNDSKIHTANDFVGKKLALNVLGAEVDYVMREYLKQNGLSIDQVQLVVVPAAQQEQVLRSGQVDVAAIGTPNVNMALEKGGLRVLFTVYDVRGNVLTYGEGFREDFIKEHPDTVKRFVRVYENSRRLVWEEFQKDPERVKKAVAQIYEEKGGNPRLAKYYRPTHSPEHSYPDDNDIQWWLDVWEKDGKLKPGQIKPSDVYTNEFNEYYKR